MGPISSPLNGSNASQKRPHLVVSTYNKVMTLCLLCNLPLPVPHREYLFTMTLQASDGLKLNIAIVPITPLKIPSVSASSSSSQ